MIYESIKYKLCAMRDVLIRLITSLALLFRLYLIQNQNHCYNDAVSRLNAVALYNPKTGEGR
jgi:hypothetical protein